MNSSSGSTAQIALDWAKKWFGIEQQQEGIIKVDKPLFFVGYYPNRHPNRRYEAGWIGRANGDYSDILPNFTMIDGVYYPNENLPS